MPIATDTKQVKIRLTAEDNFSRVLDGAASKSKRALDTIERESRQASRAVDRLGRPRGLNDFTQQAGVAQGAVAKLGSGIAAVGGIIGGVFAVGQIAGFTAELVNQGKVVARTESLFRNLTREAGGYNNVLNEMRKTTRGLVSDQELMSAGARLLGSGIAGNAQQAAEITQIGSFLGPAFSTMDAGQSVDNLIMAMMNQSYLRLDTYGINSGQVRQRVNQLTAGGMSKEEAFVQATIEAGRQVLEMSGAAEVAETNLDKLGTKIDNVTAGIGKFTFALTEGAATILNTVLEGGGGGESVLGLAEQLFEAQYGGRVGGFEERLAALTPEGFQGRLIAGETDPAASLVVPLKQEMAALRNELYRQRRDAPDSATQEELGALSIAIQRLDDMLFADASPYESQLFEFNQFRTDYLRAQGAGGALQSSIAQAVRDGFIDAGERESVFGQSRGMADILERDLAGWTGGADVIAALGNQRVNALNRFLDLDRLQDQFVRPLHDLRRGTLADGYATQEEANRAKELATALAKHFKEVMKGEDVSPEELAYWEAASASGKDIATAMQAAAKNAAAIPESLGAFLGTTTGGTRQALGEQIAGLIEDEDTRASFLRTLGLETGAVTRSSVMMEDTIAPMISQIASEMGEGLASDITLAVYEAGEAARLGGGTEREIAAAMRAAVPFMAGGAGGRQIEVQPGWGRYAVEAAYGRLSDEEYAQITDARGMLHPGMFSLGRGLTPTNVPPPMSETVWAGAYPSPFGLIGGPTPGQGEREELPEGPFGTLESFDQVQEKAEELLDTTNSVTVSLEGMGDTEIDLDFEVTLESLNRVLALVKDIAKEHKITFSVDTVGLPEGNSLSRGGIPPPLPRPGNRRADPRSGGAVSIDGFAS